MTPSGTYNLLVVDDEPDLRTLYELTLLREGYYVESAGTVEEAWRCLEARSYDAVITDMRLPDGLGLELLRRIDKSGRAEKAIVITAYGSAENAVEALKAGAFDYLTKPVDADPTQARRVLGWEPRFPDLESMVATAWAWRQEHLRDYRLASVTLPKAKASPQPADAAARPCRSEATTCSATQWSVSPTEARL